MTIALKWAYDEIKRNLHCGGTTPLVRMRFDSTSAGMKVLGDFGGQAEASLTSTARSLHRLLLQRYNAQVQGQHVFGHCGEPGNECANTVARWAADHLSTSTDTFLELLIKGKLAPALDWAWLFWRTDLSQYYSPGVFTLPQVIHEEPLSPPMTTTAAEEGVAVHFSFKLATANAMTLKCLKDKKVDYGLNGISRLESVLRQCHEASIHIVAFQESRLQKLYGQMNPFYHLHHAPATTKGHFGIILGFSKQLPFAKSYQDDGTEKAHYFQNDKITLISSTPRWLILHLRQPWLQCIIVGFHGPHTQSSDEEARQWWMDLHKAIPHRFRDLPRVALGDANGHLGDIPSVAVQSHQAEEQDRNGELFHHYLLDNDLWLPSTSSLHQRGPGGTWRHWKGHLLRNDYLALPQAWRHLQITTYVDTEIDLALKKEDHLVAACEINGQGYYPLASGSSPPLRFALPPDPEVKSQLHRIAELCPEISWTTDPSAHDRILTSSLVENMKHSLPRATKRPNKPSVSSSTWQLILRKRKIRNLLHDASQKERNDMLRSFFVAWKGHNDPAAPRTWFVSTLNKHYLHFHFQKLGREVSDAIHQDDQTFYEGLASECRQASSEKDYKKLWQIVRRQLPKYKQRRAARNPLSLAVLEDQWLPHFQELEIGHTIEKNDLEWDYYERVLQHEPSAVPRAAIPTLNQVERALRNSQPRKAAGPDGLQPEVLCFAASSLAPPVWDLMTKIVLTQTEPLQWKNGTMIPIHKKGREDLASQYRGILLSATLGKRFHSLVRGQLMDTLTVYRSPGQLGGFAHGEVLFGSQSLRVAAHIASLSQKPSAVLFLDLRHAFHHVIRELIVGHSKANPFEVECILRHLHRDGVDIRGVLQWLRHPGVLERLGAPPHLAHLIDEIHRDTHFYLPRHTETTKTKRGSRPGSPIADSMFHSIMLDLHHEVERVLEDEVDHVDTSRLLSLETLPITWADDMALLLLSSSNELIIPMVQRVTEKLNAIFQRRGFQLNLDQGKTGAVISYKGPDAATYRKNLLLQTQPGCDINQNGVLRRLHFSAVYTHLGTYFEMEGGLRAEIKRRIGLGTGAFQQLSRHVFGNRNLGVEVRLQLFESLVASKMWFGSGTWGQIPTKSLHRLDTTTMAMIRKIVGAARGPETTISDDELRSRYSIPTARARLCRDRLLYAGRLYKYGPPFLHRLLERESELTHESWLHYLHADLEWLHRVLPQDDRWPRPWQELLAYWQAGHTLWPKIVQKAFRYHLRQETIMLDVQLWQKRCLQVWKQAGVEPLKDPFATHGSLDGFVCECGKSFQTFKGLKVHQTRLHGYRAPEKALAASASCPVCQRYFWSKTRMQQHLAYAPRDGGPNQCYEMLRRLPLDSELPPEEETNEGPHALFFRKHALPIEGPPGLGATQRYKDLQLTLDRLQDHEDRATAEGLWIDPTEEQYAEWQSRFEHATSLWYDRYCSIDTPAGCLQGAWMEMACAHDAPPHTISATCLYLWGQEDMFDFISKWEDPKVIQHIEDQYYSLMEDCNVAQFYRKHTTLHKKVLALAQEPPLPAKGHRPVYKGPANATERRRLHQPVPQCFEEQPSWRSTFEQARAGSFPPAPRVPLCNMPGEPPTFVLLHLFAGRRRIGDWHSHLSTLAAKKGIRLIILSLDTAIDADLCNLHCRAAPWLTIMELLAKGYIAGLLSGAPCETFSEARHTPTATGFPRPLRDATRLWGLAGLRWRELGQLHAGSLFSLQTHWALLQLYRQGGFGVSEHPAPPKDPSRASIWRSETTELMLQDRSAFRLTIVPQYLWGAPAVKATGLLHLRLPHLRADMRQWELPNPKKPDWQAIGVDETTGCFRTSALKEYPTLFSGGLAEVFINALNKTVREDRLREAHLRAPEVSSQVERWFNQVRDVCIAIDQQATWLPDYQAARCA